MKLANNITAYKSSWDDYTMNHLVDWQNCLFPVSKMGVLLLTYMILTYFYLRNISNAGLLLVTEYFRVLLVLLLK